MKRYHIRIPKLCGKFYIHLMMIFLNFAFNKHTIFRIFGILLNYLIDIKMYIFILYTLYLFLDFRELGGCIKDDVHSPGIHVTEHVNQLVVPAGRHLSLLLQTGKVSRNGALVVRRVAKPS